jgi:hypothetical protein
MEICNGFGEDLEGDELVRIERILKMTGAEARSEEAHYLASVGGFLKPTQSLKLVCQEDGEVLALYGITHSQMAQKMRDLIRPVQTRMYSSDWTPSGDLEVKKMGNYLGSQACPFTATVTKAGEIVRLSTSASKYAIWEASIPVQVNGSWTMDDGRAWEHAIGCDDFEIRNPRNGEKLWFNSAMPHLIEEHHFFEGPGMPWRVDPKRALKVMFDVDVEIVEEYDTSAYAYDPEAKKAAAFAEARIESFRSQTHAQSLRSHLAGCHVRVDPEVQKRITESWEDMRSSFESAFERHKADAREKQL